MTERAATCPDADVLVALALGELTGRDRAEALEHLLACRTCRDEVDELMAVSEQLLLAAPEAEVPVGFESEVIDRLGPRRPRRRPVLVVAAVAAAVALLVGGLVAVVATRSAGGGEGELARAAMVTPGGREVGYAWRYEGDPGWVLLSVPDWVVWEDPSGASHDYALQAELADGSQAQLGAVTFHGEDGSWATTTDLDTEQIRSVAVVDETGHVWCAATF
jgi:hypothetical protein